MAYSSRPDARFSTYSGAPSLQPSLAPTFDSQTTSNRSSQQPLHPGRVGHNAPETISEKQPAGNRNNIYSNNDAAAQTSTSTLSSTDPKMQDIKAWSESFQRMQDERLDKQRYVMSGNKSDEVGKLALGAKVERALGRRMTGQDASFTKKRVGEKQLEVEVQ
ncbi:hypothetical protein K431DRAFT_323805 [Polychaeton citri CBS 116435]|uniref:Uncharacterized protein n=1 Tax=Polychaeton citri CBS 116435 TaxID=1314669 RepID=A0A9P4PYM1_9PEZI|nr:hypothetical protein K431DRAFT_323805 [Polychaeton citri CBS 116435]